VKENLSFEKKSLRIVDSQLKQLRGEKLIWLRCYGNLTLELHLRNKGRDTRISSWVFLNNLIFEDEKFHS